MAIAINDFYGVFPDSIEAAAEYAAYCKRHPAKGNDAICDSLQAAKKAEDGSIYLEIDGERVVVGRMVPHRSFLVEVVTGHTFGSGADWRFVNAEPAGVAVPYTVVRTRNNGFCDLELRAFSPSALKKAGVTRLFIDSGDINGRNQPETLLWEVKKPAPAGDDKMRQQLARWASGKGELPSRDALIEFANQHCVAR
jgi:hypothetical protein